MPKKKTSNKTTIKETDDSGCCSYEVLYLVAGLGFLVGTFGGIIAAGVAMNMSMIESTQLNSLADKVAAQMGYQPSIIQSQAPFITNGHIGHISLSAFDNLYYDCTGHFFLENGIDARMDTTGQGIGKTSHISAYRNINCYGNTVWSRYCPADSLSDYLISDPSNTATQFNQQFQSQVDTLQAKLTQSAQPIEYLAAGLGALALFSCIAIAVTYYKKSREKAATEREIGGNKKDTDASSTATTNTNEGNFTV
jgi:hypothetical protein